MQTFIFTCRHCQGQIQTNESVMGETAPCIHCNGLVTVPGKKPNKTAFAILICLTAICVGSAIFATYMGFNEPNYKLNDKQTQSQEITKLPTIDKSRIHEPLVNLWFTMKPSTTNNVQIFVNSRNHIFTINRNDKYEPTLLSTGYSPREMEVQTTRIIFQEIFGELFNSESFASGKILEPFKKSKNGIEFTKGIYKLEIINSQTDIMSANLSIQ